MLYIIGGVPRSGKTQIQKYLSHNYNISGISVDLLREGFYASPEFGLNDDMNELDKSAKIWTYLKGIIQARKNYDDDFSIEGTNLLPILLSQFTNEEYIKICFVGYRSMDAYKKMRDIRNNPSEAEWTAELSDEELLNLIQSYIDRSKQIEAECKIYEIKYFDISENFEEKIREIGEYLLEK